jgi:glutaredoxin
MKKKLLILFVLFALALTGCGLTNVTKVLTPDEAKAKALTFINNNLVQKGSEVTIDSISEENGLYKVAVKLSSGQTVDAFLTKDGTKFFPQAMDIAEVEKSNNTQTNTNSTGTPAAKEVPKTDKPNVELFVMSHCPYGTQIEKGIIPAVQALGSKIDFAIKFVDYSMHGDKEIAEEMNQVCIEKNSPSEYLTYLQCFLKAGDGASCLKEAKIDTAKLSDCVSDLDKQYSITKNAADKTKWASGQYPPFDVNKDDNVKYSVQGSPTLVINGVESSSGRDPASLLKAICAAFKTQPAECKTQLSSDSPAAGFGTGTTASTGSASCGN